MASADVISLAQRYQQQLMQTADSLRDRAINFKQVSQSTINDLKAQIEKQREQLQPKAAATLDGYKASIKDMETPVSTSASPFLQKAYLWSAVCLFISSVARVLSGIALSAIVGAIFDTWIAVLLTFVALPAVVFLNLRKVERSETEREQLVLFGSVAEGVMIGALFSNRFATIYGPPVFLLPLCIGLLAHYAGTKDQVAGNRRVFLGALVGGAVAGYVIYGFVFNFNFSYILSVAILGAAAVADLQLKLASIQRGDSSPQLEQWKTVVIMSAAGAVAHFLASTTDEQAAAAAEEKRAAAK